jgi:hypothetical protein
VLPDPEGDAMTRLRVGDTVHAVPLYKAIGEHRASSMCRCHPTLLYRDIESTALIWVHHDGTDDHARNDARGDRPADGGRGRNGA